MSEEFNDDIRSRITEGSGYEEFVFDESLNPYLKTYSYFKDINFNIQKIHLGLDYIKTIADLVVSNCEDDAVKVEFVNYLGDNNHIVESVNEKVTDIIDKINMIENSDYNIHDLINNNKNGLDQETITSIENLFEFLFNESQEAVSIVDNFKKELIDRYKTVIEEVLSANLKLSKIFSECEDLLVEFDEAVKEGNELELNRISEKIAGKLRNSNSENDVEINAFGYPEAPKNSVLNSIDLAQDLNNPNLLEVKDNLEMTDVEFMTMLEKKGKEYAEEYIYTLPLTSRDRYFKLMDLV